MVYYLNPAQQGITKVGIKGDGVTITLKWWRAFPTTPANKIAYNIYMDEDRVDFESTFFYKSPAFVSIDGSLTVDITDLNPGQMYRFAVRPIEYNSFDFTTLPVAFNGLRTYPESVLRANIDADDLFIPLLDVSDFPSTGVVRIGSELISYTSADDLNNNLVLSSILQRGFDGTDPTIHQTDGYDGYISWTFAGALFWPIAIEDQNTVIFCTESRFEWDHYAFTLIDGYRQTIKDIVNADGSASEIANTDFPPLDHSGFHRIDTEALLRGECVGSFFGGEHGCIDGYGFNQRMRGLSVQDIINQREEELLNLTGEPVVLIKRIWTGIRCRCLQPQQEFPDARCKYCFGGGYVVGYLQYFNLRRADSRIMMRFDPWIEDAPLTESGLEVEAVKPNGWLGSTPAVTKRDIIIRFDQAGNEEFRYEIMNVTKNMTFLDLTGAQKIALNRIRKTDIIYQIKYMKDTSAMPAFMQTSSSISLGIPLHSHSYMTNEHNPSTWQQETGISAGHNHIISWDPDLGVLVVSTDLGHTHTLI